VPNGNPVFESAVKAVTVLGLKEQLYPDGAPVQERDTDPVKLFTEFTVTCVSPTVPDWRVSDESDRLKFMDGACPEAFTAKVTVTGAAAAK